MKSNVGSLDRAVRLALAAGLVALYFAHVLTGTLGVLLLVLAAVLTLTALVRTCPLYLPFGISTRRLLPGAKPQADAPGRTA